MCSQQKISIHYKPSYLKTLYPVSISDSYNCLKFSTQDMSTHQTYMEENLIYRTVLIGHCKFLSYLHGQCFPPTRNCFSVLSIMLQKLTAAKHKTVHVVGLVIGLASTLAKWKLKKKKKKKLSQVMKASKRSPRRIKDSTPA